MRRGKRFLPPAFSLLKSEFNDFLFAPIGEEQNHVALTVLSALSRQGVDPWHLAARLSRLPTRLATRRLSAIIAALPRGQEARPEPGAVAARLVALLPRWPSRTTRWLSVMHRLRPMLPWQ